MTQPVSVTVTTPPESGAVDTVAEDTRTISGIVLPWGETGRTSTGAFIFERGSISVPKDITRVKLLAGHSPAGIPVGHATAWKATDLGLYMTFQLGSHDAASDSLLKAAEKTIDAFSIEAHLTQVKGQAVTESILRNVALVPTPAFPSARVSEVHAEEDSPAAEAPDTETTEEAKDEDMPKDTLTPGVIPTSTTTQPKEIHASLDDVVTYLAAAIDGGDAELHGALVDITDAGLTDRAAPAWLGELWSGVTYTRRIVPLMTQSPLRSRKAKGYRWTTKPTVAKYSGNKTDIHSSAAAIEAVEVDSTRWAGGNDLDRIFWDFKETDFLRAYWAALAESYALETDKAAAAFLVENATDTGSKSKDILHGIATASLKIEQDLHAPATFALINPADYIAILGYAENEAPKWLKLMGGIADPAKWVTSEFVESGTAIVGTKSAATHFELAGSPLRVEAEHIAKGGRDAALFGYTALMLNKPEGIVKTTFETAAEAA